MQNFLLLNGSPRKNGNTAVLVKSVEEALTKHKQKFSRYDLYDLNIKGCSHCNACKKIADKPACIIKDDAIEILDAMTKADVIFMFSPVYCWSFTGCLSSLHDRMYCLFKTEIGAPSLIANKKIIGAFTAGGEAFDGMQYCVGALRDITQYGNAEYYRTISAPLCTTPEELKSRTDLKKMISSVIIDLTNSSI